MIRKSEFWAIVGVVACLFIPKVKKEWDWIKATTPDNRVHGEQLAKFYG